MGDNGGERDSARAVRLEPAYREPEAVQELIERSGPFRPLALEAASDAERRASGSVQGGEFVPPWFRQNFAVDGEIRVDGAEDLLHHDRFMEAASAVFAGASVVVPTTVYVNVMGPCSYPFIAHRDVPVFRGVSRRNAPVWLLNRMLASELFEPWRIDLATAVSWFYAGEGGDFHYWPAGPEAPPTVERAPFANVAVVADNERVFHGVAPLGTPDVESPTDLSLDATMTHDGEAACWHIADGGSARAVYPDEQVRITVSWKAEVFADEADRDRARWGTDDLSLDDVVATLADDLAGQGLTGPSSDDPLSDEAFMASCAAAYPDSAPAL